MASILDILFNRKPKKPDFSNVDSSTTTSGGRASGGAIRPEFPPTGNAQGGSSVGPDFRNVDSRVGSTERPVTGGGSGGSGEHRPSVAQTYTVVSGDTLSHIARHFYGNASRWPLIFDANRDKITDPDKIFPGQVLRIPADASGSH